MSSWETLVWCRKGSVNRNDCFNSGNLGRNTKALHCSYRSHSPPSTLALQVGSFSKLAFLPVLFPFPPTLSLFLSCPWFSCPDLLWSAGLRHPDANFSASPRLLQAFGSAWKVSSSSVVITTILTAAGKFSPQNHSSAHLSSEGFFHLLLLTANTQTLRAAQKQ